MNLSCSQKRTDIAKIIQHASNQLEKRVDGNARTSRQG